MNSTQRRVRFRAPEIYQIHTRATGPAGSLPLTEEMLLNSPSGDLFGLTQNAGMGWNPAEVGRKQFLILSTQGGLRAPDGTTDRAGLSHRPLGNRIAGAGRGGGISPAAKPFPSPVSVLIRAMAARRERRACSTACRIGMTPLWFSGGWRARCRCAPACWASPRATKVCPR